MKDIWVDLGLVLVYFVFPRIVLDTFLWLFLYLKSCSWKNTGFTLFLLLFMKCLKSLDTYNSFIEKLVLLVVSAIFFFFAIGHVVPGQGSYLTLSRKEGNQQKVICTYVYIDRQTNPIEISQNCICHLYKINVMDLNKKE